VSAQLEWDPTTRLVDLLLEEQRTLSAVDAFSRKHDREGRGHGRYESLIPVGEPGVGQQLSFRVDLDACTGCKACVTACHSLNGLDEDETWRNVGRVERTVSAPDSPGQHTVTAACHHCAEPGCLAGCPVRAYEKDATTGIVRHLDDQCIGCRYCQLMCPYDVPTWSERLGIVRKCDLCHARLAEGEAPACVQGCPNEAIRIAIVDTPEVAHDEALLPVAPGSMPLSTWTKPTTRYVSNAEVPTAFEPSDLDRVEPNHAHMPLAIMLVLTQSAIGIAWADALLQSASSSARIASVVLPTLALATGLAGLGASIWHLGRPQWAFRAVLGLRTSWMSREIVVFGAFAGAMVAVFALAGLAVVDPHGSVLRSAAIEAARGPAAWSSALAGALGLFCSVQIYAVTRRPFWSFGRTACRFLGTAVWVGVAAVHLALVVGVETAAASPTAAQAALAVGLMALTALRLWFETGPLLATADPVRAPALARSRRLLGGALASSAMSRRALLFVAGVLGPLHVLMGLSSGAVGVGLAGTILLLGIAADLFERRLFFQAEAMPAMPGAG